jgi:hypothetical protein
MLEKVLRLWENCYLIILSIHILKLEISGCDRKDMRAATTLLYVNVRCCTSTYNTNPATVSFICIKTWECKCKIAMHEFHILHNSYIQFRGKATRGSKYSDIKINSDLSCWCEVLKLNGGNSNNKVKACRPSLRLLAFTEEQERELSTIRRRTTCSQTYLSTNTHTHNHTEFKSQRSYVWTRHSHKKTQKTRHDNSDKASLFCIF